MTFDFEELWMPGVFLIHPTKLTDERGWFMRSFCTREFGKKGLQTNYTQVNHSFNFVEGTFRGLHYQMPPHDEIKLVRCCQGSICDILCDIRIDSPTFLKTCMINISAQERNMIYIPAGIAHGFLTLEKNTEIIYHHDVPYAPESASTISIFDPKLKIELPGIINCISQKDRCAPYLNDEFKGI